MVAKMKIRRDDTVVVVAGNDRGKTGRVLLTLRDKGRVVVEGVNMRWLGSWPARTGFLRSTLLRATPAPHGIPGYTTYPSGPKLLTICLSSPSLRGST